MIQKSIALHAATLLLNLIFAKIGACMTMHEFRTHCSIRPMDGMDYMDEVDDEFETDVV